ncbi:tetratricopeptide repeat protein [Soonwooa sp.]|uniref:tetratricopeptide repeat protein n=1 Tax=Soonwooa sp. TaxID=1938592 RepID=UPI002625C68B|nr:tetratricopeptide repeat protein [Soonwooa sp.]
MIGKQTILAAFLLITCMFFGQNKEQASKSTQSKIVNNRQQSSEYLDYYNDFVNYALGKDCKYKKLYEKYVQVDSTAIIKKIGNKSENFPSPCFQNLGNGSVKYGMKYNYSFLMQFYEKKLYCEKDGKKYDSQFMSYKTSNYFNSTSTEKAIQLLLQHDKKELTTKELDAIFENAKSDLKNKNYIDSNGLFMFLGMIDQSYLEASLNNIGLAFYNQEQYTEALQYFEKAVKLYPSSYLGYLNAGAAKSKIPVDLGDFNQSYFYFKQAYELAPDNPNVLSNYIGSLKKLHSYDPAVQDLIEKLIQKAVTIDGNNPAFLLESAKVLHQKFLDNYFLEDHSLEDDFNKAMKAYDNIIEKFPNNPQTYLLKAKLLNSWSQRNKFPKNRIIVESACVNLSKFKELNTEKNNPNDERLCIKYPSIDTNSINNYNEILKGWELISLAKGDLNSDGHDDYVVVAREINPLNIREIIRYDTPNKEKALRNYNAISLYVLLFNPTINKYDIKSVNDTYFMPHEGYYDKNIEVKILNSTFRLIENEKINEPKTTKIFRLENAKFMCIGTSITLYKDNFGNVSSQMDKPKPDLEMTYKISYNYNTHVMEFSTIDKQGKRQIENHTVELAKYALENASEHQYEVNGEAEKIIKEIP